MDQNQVLPEDPEAEPGRGAPGDNHHGANKRTAVTPHATGPI